MVFVTGYSTGATTSIDYATIGYNAATGAQQWVKRYNGPNRNDFASAVAVSPTGGRVFVTGQSYVKINDSDWATIAYSG